MSSELKFDREAVRKALKQSRMDHTVRLGDIHAKPVVRTTVKKGRKSERE
jgi:hypothetical protein